MDKVLENREEFLGFQVSCGRLRKPCRMWDQEERFLGFQVFVARQGKRG